jgi:WD40 repeat protein
MEPLLEALCIQYLSSRGGAIGIAFSPDSSYLATYSGGMIVFTLNDGVLNQCTEYILPSISPDVAEVAFSPNGFFIATANGESNSVTIFNIPARCGVIITTQATATSATTAATSTSGISNGVNLSGKPAIYYALGILGMQALRRILYLKWN